jgi:hypothetical protein
LTAPQREALAKAEAETAAAVNAFAANTKDFPHYAQVKPLMASILQAIDDDGTKPMPVLLKEAYDQACRAHPQVFELIKAEDAKKQREAEAERRRQKLQASGQAAAVNVRSNPPNPSKRTMDEDLKALADKHYGR